MIVRVDFAGLGILDVGREPLATLLPSGCDSEASHNHLVFSRAGTANASPLITAKLADDVVVEDLVKPFNLVGEVEILGDLLDALADHGGLDDIFWPHRDTTRDCGRTSCTCTEGKVCGKVGRDLRPRSEYLPDFETSFELDNFNRFH